jgi:hypothetical protein
MKKILIKNLIPCSIQKEKKNHPFIEEGICKVDGTPYKCLYLGRFMESCNCVVYNTIIWYKGAWHKTQTSFGIGYHGKMQAISSISKGEILDFLN